jgi:hypothetical protein
MIANSGHLSLATGRAVDGSRGHAEVGDCDGLTVLRGLGVLWCRWLFVHDADGLLILRGLLLVSHLVGRRGVGPELACVWC